MNLQQAWAARTVLLKHFCEGNHSNSTSNDIPVYQIITPTCQAHGQAMATCNGVPFLQAALPVESRHGDD